MFDIPFGGLIVQDEGVPENSKEIAGPEPFHHIGVIQESPLPGPNATGRLNGPPSR